MNPGIRAMVPLSKASSDTKCNVGQSPLQARCHFHTLVGSTTKNWEQFCWDFQVDILDFGMINLKLTVETTLFSLT